MSSRKAIKSQHITPYRHGICRAYATCFKAFALTPALLVIGSNMAAAAHQHKTLAGKHLALSTSEAHRIVAPVVTPGDEEAAAPTKDRFLRVAMKDSPFTLPEDFSKQTAVKRKQVRHADEQGELNGFKTSVKRTDLNNETPQNEELKSYDDYGEIELDQKGIKPYRRQQQDPESNRYRASYQGTFSTFCVRLRDGYYWPINFASRKSDLKEDDTTCQKSCNTPVSLYYMPSGSNNHKVMKNLKGEVYKDLDNAFLYQTKYIAEAKCRPKPWSQKAKARHAAYADKDLANMRRLHEIKTRRTEKNRLIKKLSAQKRLLEKHLRQLAENKKQ